MKTDLTVTTGQRAHAKAMRRAPTDAELRLWRLLRDRRLSGFKFRRQVPVGPYIADFLCVSAQLIVEADGSQHAESIPDEERDSWLARRGWRVLRFWNHEVLTDRANVVETIYARASERSGGTPSSDPSGHLLPEGEGVVGPSSDRFRPSPSGRRWTRGSVAG
jgi:adenine-specific DNA-methyltransferase